MLDKRILIAFMLITTGLMFVIPISDESVAETSYSTLEVGSGKTYSSIQSAIDAASSGDLIKIYAGTYYENVIVNKTLMIIGQGPDYTIVDGNGSGSAMIVESDDCLIGGLAFTGSGGEEPDVYFNAGLRLNSDSNIVQNCTAYDNFMGILCSGGDNNKLVYCESYENEIHGIGLGRYSTIQACYSHDNGYDGFWAFVNPGSSLERCRAENNGADGFSLDHTEDVTAREFISRNNDAYGISISGGGGGNRNNVLFCLIEGNGNGGIEICNVEGPLKISNNTLRNNLWAAVNFTYGNMGSGFIVKYNRIENNSYHGVAIHFDPNYDPRMEIYGNDIINSVGNVSQALDDGTASSWDRNSRGNYWNDWTTPDSNSDGIVDAPYIIDGGRGQKDNFPLTSPASTGNSHLPSNDLWDNGKFYVDMDGGYFPPSGDDDDQDDVEPPADDDEEPADDDTPTDDDETPSDDDDTVPPLDDYNVSGTPDIEFQNEPYYEGEDQQVSVPDEFLADNDDLSYEWYIEGWGIVGHGETVDLDLPEGVYNLTLIGKDSEGNVVFQVSRDLLVKAPMKGHGGLSKFFWDYLPFFVIIITILLLIAAFGFILGRRRKQKDQVDMTVQEMRIPQGQRVILPDPSDIAASGDMGEVRAGKLDNRTMMERYTEARVFGIELPTEDDLDYDGMKALSEAVGLTISQLGKGSSMERTRALLDRKHREGSISKDEFQELKEALDRHAK